MRAQQWHAAISDPAMWLTRARSSAGTSRLHSWGLTGQFGHIVKAQGAAVTHRAASRAVHSAGPLTLRAGAHVRTHPDKAKARQPGEDALFYHCVNDGCIMAGVADGTSAAGTYTCTCFFHGWIIANSGSIDGGGYARRLMQRAESTVQNDGVQTPAALLDAAWRAAAEPPIEGRATSCVVRCDPWQ